jgi:DMSO reductase anchor subunit
MKAFLRILYVLFVAVSLLVCVWGIWINGMELVDRAMGHDTYISQMENLSVKQSVLYSVIYFLPFVALLVLGIRFAQKGSKKIVLLLSVLVWLLILLETYSDWVFAIHI